MRSVRAMSKKVTWGQRIDPEDRDFIDAFIEKYRVEKGLKSKADAFVHYFRKMVPLSSDETMIPEVYSSDDLEFEKTCPFGFLKKISEKQSSDELWHCLKQQGPDSKGRPMLLADGHNKQSIRAICETCQINWQRKPSNLDQFKLIFQKMGDSLVSGPMYLCIRNILEGKLSYSTTEYGKFPCPDSKGDEVTIKHTCKAKTCPNLIKETVTLSHSETFAYVEAEKALEKITE
jgi:hypothetical protein